MNTISANGKKIAVISISFFFIVNIIWLGMPFGMAIIWSLVDPAHPWSYPDIFPQVLSFGRWIQVWQTTSLPEALANSYMVAPAVALLTLTLAMPTAYAFGRLTFRGKKIAEMVSLLPMVMPSMILAVFFSSMLLELGMTNPYLNIVLAHTV